MQKTQKTQLFHEKMQKHMFFYSIHSNYLRVGA